MGGHSTQRKNGVEVEPKRYRLGQSLASNQLPSVDHQGTSYLPEAVIRQHVCNSPLQVVAREEARLLVKTKTTKTADWPTSGAHDLVLWT